MADGGPPLARAEFPEAEVVVDSANRGYGAAANLGARRSHMPYLLVLNSDTVVAPSALAGAM